MTESRLLLFSEMARKVISNGLNYNCVEDRMEVMNYFLI